MARRRMIDPGFWASEHNMKMNFRQRLLFLGLISNADDKGRIKANSNYLRATIFPYDNISNSQMSNDLKLLKDEALIIIYTVDDVDYIQVTKWDEYQRVDHPQPSKIPSPNALENIKHEDSNNSENDSKNNSENDSYISKSKVKEVSISEKNVSKHSVSEEASPHSFLNDAFSLFYLCIHQEPNPKEKNQIAKSFRDYSHMLSDETQYEIVKSVCKKVNENTKLRGDQKKAYFFGTLKLLQQEECGKLSQSEAKEKKADVFSLAKSMSV